MFRTVVVAVLAAAVVPACTTNVVIVEQVVTSTSGDETTGFQSMTIESTITEELEGTSTSGDSTIDHDPSTSTSTGDESTTTTTGGATTSTAEPSTEATSTTIDSTTDDPSTGTTDDGSSGEPVPVGKAVGELCLADDECESEACIGSEFEPDVKRCSVTCSIEVADDCHTQGHPGLCTWGGAQHWCSGYFPQVVAWSSASPFYHDNKFLATPDQQHAYLLPTWPAPFFIETSAGNDPGYGPIVFDLYSASGTLLGTYDMGTEPVIEPAGVTQYHWLVVRPAAGIKSLYHVFLKDVCWPNCP